jgi:hypothetical protein
VTPNNAFIETITNGELTDANRVEAILVHSLWVVTPFAKTGDRRYAPTRTPTTENRIDAGRGAVAEFVATVDDCGA